MFRIFLLSLGWGHFSVEVTENADVSDHYKAYAAGVLEGFLTRTYIRDFFLNSRALIRPPGALEKIQKVFSKSIERVKDAGDGDLWDHDSPLDSKDAPDIVDQQVRLVVLQVRKLTAFNVFIVILCDFRSFANGFL